MAERQNKDMTGITPPKENAKEGVKKGMKTTPTKRATTARKRRRRHRTNKNLTTWRAQEQMQGLPARSHDTFEFENLALSSRMSLCNRVQTQKNKQGSGATTKRVATVASKPGTQRCARRVNQRSNDKRQHTQNAYPHKRDELNN